MNKKNNKKNGEKKLILWEGMRKELSWIAFWTLLLIMAYGYYQDKKICEEVLSDPCGICYKLNQTLINPGYVPIDYTHTNLTLDESVIMLEDKNPNARTISDYRD